MCVNVAATFIAVPRSFQKLLSHFVSTYGFLEIFAGLTRHVFYLSMSDMLQLVVASRQTEVCQTLQTATVNWIGEDPSIILRPQPGRFTSN